MQGLRACGHNNLPFLLLSIWVPSGKQCLSLASGNILSSSQFDACKSSHLLLPNICLHILELVSSLLILVVLCCS